MKTPCVYIVGAGPGDPSLISVRGRRYLEAADVVVYDHRVHAAAAARRAAGRRADRRRAGGAEAARSGCDLLPARREGARGQDVVRLKWGDPFVFDSGGKEALFLHEQGIPFEVVPGIPAAIGGLATPACRSPIRTRATLLTFVRGHEAETEAAAATWTGRGSPASTGTIVCYAGARQIGRSCNALLAHGNAPTRNAALIYDRTLPSQRPSAARSARSPRRR